MSRTIKFTLEGPLDRRKNVLDRLEISSLAEFRDQIAHGALSGDNWYAAEDLSEIDFLLAMTKS